MPPVWVRRLVIAPAVVALAIVLLTTLPFWLIVALAASPLMPRHLRVPLRDPWLEIVEKRRSGEVVIADLDRRDQRAGVRPR